MNMTAPAHRRMTSDEFLAWAVRRPDSERYELVAGEVVAMAPERAAHGRIKGNMYRALRDGIDLGRLPCEAFVGGMSVEVDAQTVYEPDVLLRCGEPLSDDAIRVTDPLIVVEVLSRSSRARDTGAKLEDYFRLASLRHYLIVKTENRTIIHHMRNEPSGTIVTRTVGDGMLRLDPPGIELRNIFT
jgi:Uma2 family endonuclease